MEHATRIEKLNDMLKKEPDDVFLNYALGLELVVDPNNINQAESQFKKVLNLDENYIAVYYQLGKLFEARLEINEAINYYTNGLEKAKRQKNNKAVNEFNEAIFMLED